MSIVTHTNSNEEIRAGLLKISREKGSNKVLDEKALYVPTQKEKETIAMVLKDFTKGYVNMHTPRVELNDLSVVDRYQYDMMAFNSYQSNNGEPYESDSLSSWRSRAMRPVVRNKCISIAAHATSRLIFPKVFAYDENSDIQTDAASVMNDLMEWAGIQSNYEYFALQRVIEALFSPASIGYTEYAEVYRRVKTERNEKGEWQYKEVRDEAFPCFQDISVPVDQIYIENVYEPDIQKQGFVCWRRVVSYSNAQSRYAGHKNFEYVRPGVQTICGDANEGFYYVYDPSMAGDMVEEIIYWNRALDLKVATVNGILVTEYDAANPRLDKLYPFDKFGYELINNRFFYFKSLAFKMMQDANVINTLYPMIVDGTYLQVMPAMVNVGGDAITSDVMIPGAVTSLTSPDAKLTPVSAGANLSAGMNTLQTLENSISESSQEPLQQGINQGGSQTAYEISRLEQNANTVLGLFVKMIGEHVRQFGNLRMSDIVQYMTIPETNAITGDEELVYKSFVLPEAESGQSTKNRKIEFTLAVPNEMTEEESLDHSYELLEKAGEESEIVQVNPERFRSLKYQAHISPDVVSPKSVALQRALKLELFDRAIQLGEAVEQQPLVRDFLFGAYKDEVKNPSKYLKDMSQQPAMIPGGMPQGAPSAQPLPQEMNSVV